MTDQESIKFDICCAARLLHRQGLSVANAGHLSVAVGPDEMLVNHYGPSFATLRPENVVRVSFAGKVLGGDAYVNDTIRLHGIIHRENPRAVAVAHTHPPSVVTLSALRVVPEIYDQESCLLADMAERNLSVAQAARNLGREPVAIAPAVARRAKAEIARIPVLPLLWKDFLARLRQTDPDLFEGREN